jgi:hypothetical protein
MGFVLARVQYVLLLACTFFGRASCPSGTVVGGW